MNPNGHSHRATPASRLNVKDVKVLTTSKDDTFKKANTISEIETLVFLNNFVYSYINLFEGLEKNTVSFKAYRPPLLSTDLVILNESFLI